MKIRKLFTILVIISMLLTVISCGDPMTIENKIYGTYGIFNENSMKNEKIEYRVSVGNVIWGIILFETIIAPVYFFGFSMFEPIGKKTGDDSLKGVIP